MDPFAIEPDVFRKVKIQLESLLQKARNSAEKKDSKVVLAGILPSISMNEISLDYMTPQPRYFALNEMLCRVEVKPPGPFH